MKKYFRILAFVAFFAIVSCQFRSNSKRISQTKCESYKSLVPKRIKYGRIVYDCKQASGNIVGGEDTTAGEFPHMAAIGWEIPNSGYKFPCGGSLISEKFVLTAAHCEFYKGKTPDIVRLGEQNLFNIDDGAEPVDHKIKNFLGHEKYNPSTRENDIAVIELNTPVTFTKFIRPACLNQVLNLPDKVIATGWEQNGTYASTTDELQKVSLDVIDQEACKKKFEEEDTTVFASQICAGGTTDKKDTCNGDSGGPIQTCFTNAKCLYKIVGVTSYGNFVCGSEMPALYTRVSSYLDWIESKVWPQ